MPKRSVQQRAGFRGEDFVAKVVSDRGHVWNDTRRDFALDGQIEFVDADREVTGVAVVAQVKATESDFLVRRRRGSHSPARGTTSPTGCGWAGRWC